MPTADFWLSPEGLALLAVAVLAAGMLTTAALVDRHEARLRRRDGRLDSALDKVFRRSGR